MRVLFFEASGYDPCKKEGEGKNVASKNKKEKRKMIAGAPYKIARLKNESLSFL